MSFSWVNKENHDKERKRKYFENLWAQLLSANSYADTGADLLPESAHWLRVSRSAVSSLMMKKEKCFPSCCLQQMTPAYKGANPSVCNSNLSSFHSLKTLSELYSMTRMTGWLNASSQAEEREPERWYSLSASCLKRVKCGFSTSQPDKATMENCWPACRHQGPTGAGQEVPLHQHSKQCIPWTQTARAPVRYIQKTLRANQWLRKLQSYIFVLFELDISSLNCHGLHCATRLTRRARTAAVQADSWFWHSKEQL